MMKKPLHTDIFKPTFKLLHMTQSSSRHYYNVYWRLPEICAMPGNMHLPVVLILKVSKIPHVPADPKNSVWGLSEVGTPRQVQARPSRASLLPGMVHPMVLADGVMGTTHSIQGGMATYMAMGPSPGCCENYNPEPGALAHWSWLRVLWELHPPLGDAWPLMWMWVPAQGVGEKYNPEPGLLSH